MKIALLGRGKTGDAFFRLANERHEVVAFDRTHPLTREALTTAEVVVSFLPAAALADYLPLLLESEKPVISGTTGFSYEALENLRAPWIFASNFSLGMNVMFFLIKILAKVGESYGGQFQIREVHHTSKLDSPSGTALRLQALLPQSGNIQAERVGDAKGFHSLELILPHEKISVAHEAFDRTVFGEGALWAVENILPGLPPGLHQFEEILEQRLRKEMFYGGR